MKKIIYILFFLLQNFCLTAQVSFTTVVPQQSITVGESFQVQYIIEGEVNNEDIKPPSFDNFRLVTGPYIYMGSITTVHGPKKVKNIIYTLEALKSGKFVISGASLLQSQKALTSNDVIVTVVSAKEALRKSARQNNIPNTDYFLRPGEDPYKKIKENLFLKVQVDKKSCYTGQPVLATFKLYSCLQSKSDIIKNPGFYGFSVFDMINLSDKEVTAEKVNGKIFDVHTIRKVQLFPLRSGIFIIDPMQVRNKVEFSRTAVNKKTEQEIAEGILGNDNQGEKMNAIYFESDFSTEPVYINVKPLPLNSKPADFNGAIGNFSIAASILKNEYAKNAEGVFEITVKGTGNFIQLIAPVVNWPEGVDAFEPTVKDNFDISLSPLTGSRTFRFPFVCTVKGPTQIPSVQFTYFDIDSNRYKSIATSPVKFAVTDEQKANPVIVNRKIAITDINKNSSLIAGSIVIGLVLIVLIYWSRRKKETTTEAVVGSNIRPDAAVVLKLPLESVNDTDNTFYKNLYQSLWTYLADCFKLEGSMVNKAQLLQAASQKGIPVEITNKLELILSACEAGQFTNATPVGDRQTLFDSAKEIIAAIEQYLL